MEKTDGWFCFSQGLCSNFWFVCVTSILLCHLMGSWHSPWLFHTPVRAGSCCEMKSLLILLSHLFSFSHTHMPMNTPISTNPYVLCAVSVLSWCFPCCSPRLALHQLTHLLLSSGFQWSHPRGGCASGQPWLPLVRTGPGRTSLEGRCWEVPECSRSGCLWSKILPSHQLGAKSTHVGITQQTIPVQPFNLRHHASYSVFPL